jgi:O-antigen ligase
MTTEASASSARLELEDFFLLPAILLLPWAFGGVEIWAFRSAALLIVLGAAVALVKRGWDGLGLDGRGSLWLLPAFLLAAWAAFQIVPLPGAVVRVLSPEAHAVYSEAFPAYAGEEQDSVAALEARALKLVPEAEEHALPDGNGSEITLAAPDCLSRKWRSLSLEPGATEERLLWYLALLLGFMAVRTRAANHRRRSLYLAAFVGSGAALALFAIVQAQTGNGKIYWVRETRVSAHPFGPYVNPTHLGGLMELAVPPLVALAWSRLRLRGRDALYEARFTLAALGAAICLAAGLASSSKMAAMLLAGSLILLGAFGARSHRIRLIVVGTTLALIVLGVVVLSESELGARVISYVEQADTEFLLEGRAAVWRASASMFTDFPVTGSGYGSFREVFPRYTPPGARLRFAQAHNDYLEVLLEGGLVGFALLAWLSIAYLTRVRRRMRRLGAGDRLVALGILVGVAALSVHAFFDFNHQMPANALLFVAMCALLVPSGSAPRTIEEAP